MTITLGYTLSQPLPGTPQDLETADEGDLLYSLFLGDVIFTVGDADFSTKQWGWVPVLDLALGLHYVVGALRRGDEEAEFDFTESESTIRFQRDGGEVFISASYAPHRAAVTLEDLEKAVALFRAKVSDDLSSAHPSLRINSAFRKLTES